MYIYKTSSEKIINIFKEKLYSDELDYTITDYTDSDIKVQGGVFEIDIKCKEDRKKHETTVLINWKYVGDPKFAELSKIGGLRCRNQLFLILLENLDENEIPEETKKILEDEKAKEKLMVSKENKRNKIYNYLWYGIAAIIPVSIIFLILSWGFEGYTYCNGFSISSSNACYEFDNGTVKQYYKGRGGIWKLHKQFQYYVDKESITFNGEKHDAIRSKGDDFFGFIVMDKLSVAKLKYFIPITGEATETYYKTGSVPNQSHLFDKEVQDDGGDINNDADREEYDSEDYEGDEW
tara:strand:- start:103 stop:981 length:879 start_codon:yes stop_codon:yes gene_type:complete